MRKYDLGCTRSADVGSHAVWEAPLKIVTGSFSILAAIVSVNVSNNRSFDDLARAYNQHIDRIAATIKNEMLKTNCITRGFD